jgi:hypothetical protein
MGPAIHLPNIFHSPLSEIYAVCPCIGSWKVTPVSIIIQIYSNDEIQCGSGRSLCRPRMHGCIKSGLMIPIIGNLKEQQQQEKEKQQSPLWRPPMKMVAGGAERAYGQEYYEGACGWMIL